MKKLQIKCPDSHLSQEERTKEIINTEFLGWVRSKPFRELLHLFLSEGEEAPEPANKEYLFWLQSKVAENWDFRKRQREAKTSEGEAARWLLRNTEFVEVHQEEIWDASRELGLIEVAPPILHEADYILPLGGARMSNLRRPQLAYRTAKMLSPQKGIVALSALRPIADSERAGYMDVYAPEAETEFDAISKGMELAFQLHMGYSDSSKDNENSNLCSVVRKYHTGDPGVPIYVVAAPSTDPDRRANSGDCFAFFFRSFDVKSGDKLICCTSQIYCTYQQVKALPYAVRYNVEIDTIGYPAYLNVPDGGDGRKNYPEAVNCLQEIKATVDAMCEFVKEYGE
ncbi:MAG: hypothetical protein IJ833_10800 [Lachnospiraceae bacterium]|nr:hypothetical protein [Lachnospiraceae bacterium]